MNCNTKLVLGLFSFVLFACNPAEVKKETADHRIYTSAQNRLYFKNVRSIYYTKESNSNAYLDYYRYKDACKRQEIPVLNLCIVDAWDRDEAYLLVENNDFFDNKDTFAINWLDEKSGMTGKFVFERHMPNQEYKFAADLFASMRADIKLSYKGKVIFDETRKKAFVKTFRDYENLIRQK
jgi:hypothetical protein